MSKWKGNPSEGNKERKRVQIEIGQEILEKCYFPNRGYALGRNDASTASLRSQLLLRLWEPMEVAWPIWCFKTLAINKLSQREALKAGRRAEGQLGDNKGPIQAGAQSYGREET